MVLADCRRTAFYSKECAGLKWWKGGRFLLDGAYECVTSSATSRSIAGIALIHNKSEEQMAL